MSFRQREVYLTPDSGAARIPVAVEVARVSKTLRNLIDDVGLESLGDESIAMPMSPQMLECIVEYMTEHQRDADADAPAPESMTPAARRTYAPSELDAAFIARHAAGDDTQRVTALIGMLLAANYADIGGLLNLAAYGIARVLDGKTPAQMRAVFGLPDDFTPDEMEALEAEYACLREHTDRAESAPQPAAQAAPAS